MRPFAAAALVLEDPYTCFYAGSQLVTREGDAPGTLRDVDRQPRTLTQGQREALRRQAQGQFELRRNLIELRPALARSAARWAACKPGSAALVVIP